MPVSSSTVRNSSFTDLGRLLTIKEVALLLAVSVNTIRSWIQRRQIEFVKIGSAVRFRPETIQDIINRGLRKPVGSAL